MRKAQAADRLDLGIDEEMRRLASARYVRISLASQLTGLTVKAINHKIDAGVWREGREWHRGPDGNRYVDMEGYAAWVRAGPRSL